MNGSAPGTPSRQRSRLRGAAAGVWARKQDPAGIPPAGRKMPVGVSLLELMIVLAVIGLLSLPGIHRFQNWVPAARTERAAREVAALLEWCRWQAIAHGCVYRVVVNSDEEQLAVFAEPESITGDDTWVRVRGIDLRERFPGVVLGAAPGTYRTSGCSVVDPSGVHLRDGRVNFLPHGVSDRSGSVYLLPETDLPGRQDRTVAVTLLLSTGRMQMWRYDPLRNASCPTAGGWQAIF